MPTVSNASFGSRIQKAKDLIAIVTLYPGFSPVRQEDNLAAMQLLIDNITTANDDVINQINAYNTAVEQRKIAYKSDPHAIEKLISPIRNSIKAQYGNNSIEMNQTETILQRMRPIKPTIVAATATAPQVSISNVELSYGAMAHSFGDLIQTIASFNNYMPIAPHLSISSMQAQLVTINALNTATASFSFKLSDARLLRATLYTDLTTRIQRIKAYVAANYGTKSNEFKNIKGLKV